MKKNASPVLVQAPQHDMLGDSTIPTLLRHSSHPTNIVVSLHDDLLGLLAILEDPASLDAEPGAWNLTLPCGVTVRANLVERRWVVSLWYQREMLVLWDTAPYGEA